MSHFVCVDAPNTAWRSFHARLDSPRSYRVIHGILREVVQLATKFGPDGFVFCFDCPRERCVRYAEYPAYKMGRVRVPSDDAEVTRQLHLLYQELLPAAGFGCVVGAVLEADDWMALAVRGAPAAHFTLVSTDTDLYQLLAPQVSIWSPFMRQLLTPAWLEERHGLTPAQWPLYRALCGDRGDNIKGVVGLQSARAYMQGRLATTSVYHRRIEAGAALIARNLHLVRLPHPSCTTDRPYRPARGTTTRILWQQLVKAVKAEFLADAGPWE